MINNVAKDLQGSMQKLQETVSVLNPHETVDLKPISDQMAESNKLLNQILDKINEDPPEPKPKTYKLDFDRNNISFHKSFTEYHNQLNMLRTELKDVTEDIQNFVIPIGEDEYKRYSLTYLKDVPL